MKDHPEDRLQPPAAGQESFSLPQRKQKTVAGSVWEWLRILTVAAVLGLLVTHFVAQRNTVSGDSMQPALLSGDELVVEKLSKWFGGIKRGDIITVHLEPQAAGRGEQNIIKRVVGLPGDHIRIEGGLVWLNGQKLDEPYLEAGTRTSAYEERYADLTLAEDEYYLLGDNRARSKDSRRFGPVKKGWILGGVLIRFWPPGRVGQP